MSNLNVGLSQVYSGSVSSSLLQVLLLGAGVSNFSVTRINCEHTGKRLVETYVGQPSHLAVVELSDDDADYRKLNEKTSIFREHTLESSDGKIKYHIGFVFEKSYIPVPRPCRIGGLKCRNSACTECFGLGRVVKYNLVSSEINFYEQIDKKRFKKVNLPLNTKDILNLVKKHKLLVEMREIQKQLENF